MNHKFYFGNIAFDIYCPFEINWNTSDKHFLEPAVPTERIIYVHVNANEKLHEKEGIMFYSGQIMDIYRTAETELRYFYNTWTREKILLASAVYQKDRIDIRVNHTWTSQSVSVLMMLFMEKILLEQNGMILHCCYMESTEGAILFSAPSGTGKTTQSNIWNKVYGTRVINGDRCLIQKNKDEFFANGFFQHGTAVECENVTMPIRAVVIIRQSNRNYIEELAETQKVMLLYSECTVNSWDEADVNKALDLLQNFATQTRVFMLHCTMEDTAAIVLHDYLKEMV